MPHGTPVYIRPAQGKQQRCEEATDTWATGAVGAFIPMSLM